MLVSKENKKGWIKIVEVFAAILIIASVVLIAIQQSQGEEEDVYTRVQADQIKILREIQLNDTLRSEIIATPGIVEWDSFPTLTKNKITAKTPNYMGCTAMICETGNLCTQSGSEGKAVYAETVIIAATLDNYNPKQLKLFCTEK